MNKIDNDYCVDCFKIKKQKVVIKLKKINESIQKKHSSESEIEQIPIVNKLSVEANQVSFYIFTYII